MTRQRCGKCKEMLPLDRFWRQKDGKYGRMTTCKVCRQTDQKAASRRAIGEGDPIVMSAMKRWGRA